MTPAQRDRAETIAKAMLTDVPSSKEVAALVAKIISFVKESIKQMQGEVASVKATYAPFTAAEARLTTLISKTAKQTTSQWYKDLSNEVYKLERAIKGVPQFDSAQLEAKWTEVVHEVNAKLDAIKPFILQGAEVRDSLEALSGEDRLDASAVKNLDKYVTASIKKPGGPTSFGGVQLYVDGVLKGTSRYINFISGSGVTLTPATVGERTDITVTAGGGSLTEITLTGTIDDSNVTFTAASQPTYLIINGAMYKKTGGAITWGYVAGTITLSQAVGTGGSIYGLS